jgi:serine/threonine protein kinase
MSESSSSERNPVEELAEEFLERCRRGERPALSEYTQRYPEWADKIRSLFPLLVDMEAARPAPQESPTPTGGVRVNEDQKLERLGDYQVLREVGRGGMGIVYEAVQVSLGRHVALKVLPRHALLEPRHLQRFQREAKAAARLHHTNIVPVYGVGEENGLHYYVMQFIQGLGLDEVLVELRRLRQPKPRPGANGEISDNPAQAVKEGSAAMVAQSLLSGRFSVGPGSGGCEPPVGEASGSGARPREAHVPRLPGSGARQSDSSIRLPGQSAQSTLSHTGRQYWQSVARIGVQVAEALAYASSQGILHRDIKPSNLVLDLQGNVWVTDFGLAKAMVDEEGLTHPGDIVGTLRYMAPERFEGCSDIRADVYSLGLTLYELLVQRPAFTEGDRNKLIHQLTHEEPLRPRRLESAVPQDLETVVLKAIARDPAHRYQTAGELADDLKRFGEDRPVKARRVSVAERLWRWCKRNPVVAGLTAAVLLLLAAVAGVASVGYVRARVEEEKLRQHFYAARINLLQHAWDMNQVGRLRALLAETEDYPDRGFEWYYWQHLCHLELHTLIGHQAQIYAVSWSPDGKRLATGSWDGTAKVWETMGGRELRTLKAHTSGVGHTSGVHSVSWSPDGKRLATASIDGTAKVWDPADGRELLLFKGHTARIFSVSWSPDGKRLATGSEDRTAKVWDAADGRELLPLKGHTARILSVSWSPDGKRLATGSEDGTAKVWDAADGRELLGLNAHRSPVSSVSWSPDGQRLATGSGDGTAKVAGWQTAGDRKHGPHGEGVGGGGWPGIARPQRAYALRVVGVLVAGWQTAGDRKLGWHGEDMGRGQLSRAGYAQGAYGEPRGK